MGGFLAGLLPTAATLLGGPAAGIAVKFLADKLGISGSTQEVVTDTLKKMTGTPEDRLALAQIDADLAKHAADLGLDMVKLSVENAKDINTTMQAEAKGEHWATWFWRPSIGMAIALNVVLSSVTVMVAYIGVMFFKLDSTVLSYIPAMLAAMAALLAAPSGIVGVASYFRGKMQADPAIPNPPNPG